MPRSNGVEEGQWQNLHRRLEEDQAAGEAFFALLVRTMRSREPLELDHIINHRSGGTDELINLQWLCVPCHKAKTQQEAAARRGKYRRPPKPPLT